MLAGLSFFFVGSLICGVAHDSNAMLAGRGIQGAGAGIIFAIVEVRSVLSPCRPFDTVSERVIVLNQVELTLFCPLNRYSSRTSSLSLNEESTKAPSQLPGVSPVPSVRFVFLLLHSNVLLSNFLSLRRSHRRRGLRFLRLAFPLLHQPDYYTTPHRLVVLLHQAKDAGRKHSRKDEEDGLVRSSFLSPFSFPCSPCPACQPESAY
jgi:hypothetical protein